MPGTIARSAYSLLVRAAFYVRYSAVTRFPEERDGWFGQRLHPALPPPTGNGRIWIHAACTGEAKISEQLRRALLAERPDVDVVLSATTPSGLSRMRDIAGPSKVFPAPLDTYGVQQHAFDTVRPDAFVLVESEFWPAQLTVAAEAGVPIFVVNASFSERSMAGHQRWPAVTRATLGKARHIYAQDAGIAGRLLQVGIAPDKVSVCGNLKLAPPPNRLPPDRTGPRTITFGNIRTDELALLAPVVAALRRDHPGLRIILVPRHPSDHSADSATAAFGGDLAYLTDPDGLDAAGDFVWLGAMGVIGLTYRRSELVVVCGTFGAAGGHDLAEPFHFGAASVYGPNTTRQSALQAALSAAGCAVEVGSADELPGMIGQLLADGGAERCVRQFQALSGPAEDGLQQVARDLLAVVPDARAAAA